METEQFYSNCYYTSWSEYLKDPSRTYIIFKQSPYSLAKGKIPSLVQSVFQKIIFIHLGIAFLFIHVLAFGGWVHVISSKELPNIYKEFIPVERKKRRWFPPLRFLGRLQTIKKV